MAELALHTFKPPAGPDLYENVAGMSLSQQGTIWDVGIPSVRKLEASVTPISRVFKVPDAFALRVFEFMRMFNTSRVIASISIGSHPSFEQPIPNINCHSFASVVTNEKPNANAYLAEWQAKKIITGQTLAPPPLKAGQQGVIGKFDETKRWKLWGAEPFHSIVGLGPEYKHCIQVISLAGWLALSTYDDILTYYSVDQPNSDMHLYVRPAQESR